MREQRGILDYDGESVAEALTLLADRALDPDPDRRADLARALRGMDVREAAALVAAEQGYSKSAISRHLHGRRDPQWAERLLVRAFAHLREGMNGYVADRTARRPVLR